MLTKGRAMILAAGALIGALLGFTDAATKVWELQPFALAADVLDLQEQQVDTAIEVYEQKELDLILKGGSVAREGESDFNRTQQYLIDRELQKTREHLELLRKRKIELAE